MRALKSVLVMAGALKRANPDLAEDIVLIRAMRDSNIPKFLSEVCCSFPAALTLPSSCLCNAVCMPIGIHEVALDVRHLTTCILFSTSPQCTLHQDARLFNAIVGDLFPGVEITPQDYGDLQVGRTALLFQ
jgi:hypothetical protein